MNSAQKKSGSGEDRSRGFRGSSLNATTPSRSLSITSNPQPTPLKTADTLYSGVLFRSRLEARWAVFFDCLHLRWQYEPEAFLLPDGTPYAPTFLIHTPQGKRRWICIKPAGITSDPHFTAFEVAVLSIEPVTVPQVWPTLVSGSPLEWMQAGHSFCPRCGMGNESRPDSSGWLYCEPCDQETPFGNPHPPESGVRGIACEPADGHIALDPETAETWDLITKEAAEFAQRKRLDFAPDGARGS